MFAPTYGADPVPLFEDEDPGQQVHPSMVRLKRGLWGLLSRIAEVETERRRRAGLKPPVISRNDVIERFLQVAAEDYAKREGLELAPAATQKAKKPRK